jgi:photosystem I subunit 10
MVASTGLCLAAGKFGLAPTVKQGTTAGLKLVDRPNSAGIMSNDPSGRHAGHLTRGTLFRGCKAGPSPHPLASAASGTPALVQKVNLPPFPPKHTAPGFTIVDTLALGALGHVLGVGIVLGLRATGGL